ncbi:uncharacterized protein LOC109414198 [Aedes albopictus]|uniref:F-box domain-containing protein n=1 Tax=Aedes albopictus TaxID=7160 RepID=A0ABM1YN76_AEDAL
MDLPSLYQLSVKTFVRNLKHNSKSRAPISELHDLPPNVLCTVFEEMSSHSSLTEITHRELSDPVLYMRVFSLNYTARKSLEKSVCNVSRNGVCALSEMARNWCKIMSDEEKRKRYPSLATNFRGALELGTYLHDAGLAQLSAEVLYIARRMIPQDNNGLKIECVRSILRAEVSALYKMKAEETCRTLLTMVDDTTDDEVRIKVFLEVTKHHFKACRYSEMNRWIQKAQEFITETTPPEIVIECQQLNALHLFHSKMILDAYSIFKQAIDRTREIFGHHHRRYAETLYTFGATLVKNRYCYGFQMLLYGIQMLIEVLIIFTTLYGERTPHANDIYRYLALARDINTSTDDRTVCFFNSDCYRLF